MKFTFRLSSLRKFASSRSAGVDEAGSRTDAERAEADVHEQPRLEAEPDGVLVLAERRRHLRTRRLEALDVHFAEPVVRWPYGEAERGTGSSCASAG